MRYFFSLLLLLAHVKCVRWSANGNLLASAGGDTVVNLFDLKTENVIYTGVTPDGCKFEQEG